MPDPSNPVLVRLLRADREESVHRGAWVVVDTAGGVVEHAGAPEQPVFARSSTKSLQALPLIETGAADTFGLTSAEIAIAIASHNGQDIHVEAARSMLSKAGLDETSLQCGPQRPAGSSLAAEAQRIANNCSGKHAAFLACAAHLGIPPRDYLDPGSEVQQLTREALLSMSGADSASVTMAIDGCSAPTFRLPLRALGAAIARITNPGSLEAARADACRRIVASARAHPDLVGGTSTPRFDSDLLRATEGRLFAKTGAEGMQVVGIVGSGLGFAAKIDDGSKRSIAPLTLGVLSTLGLISALELEALKEWTDPVRRNFDGLDVGRRLVCEEELPDPR